MSAPDLRTAIREALAEELERDAAVVLLGGCGEDPGGALGYLRERFGPERVLGAPSSGLALAGAAYGAAVAGLRPVFELASADLITLAMDGLVNRAAKFWHVSGGQGTVPLVARAAVGAGCRRGAIDSQSPCSWLQGVPGLKIAFPSSPAEARGLLKGAIRDDNPVVFLEHRRLRFARSAKGPVPEPDGEAIPLGGARVARAGRDLTIVSAGGSVSDALDAADLLAGDGVDAEVLDLRTLRPLDLEAVLESVARTNRLLAVEEGPRLGGWAAGLLGLVAERALHDLDDAWTLTMAELPIPYSPTLEDALLADAGSIVAGVRARLGLAPGVG